MKYCSRRIWRCFCRGSGSAAPESMVRKIVMAGLLSTVAPGLVAAQPSLHRIVFVAVQPDVRLEILDWGGRGPALVFLAGFGNTGHVFDGFAPQFTNRYHVIAITRRGFGDSSHPDTGYDTRSLALDITAVLDSLRVARASWSDIPSLVRNSATSVPLTRIEWPA